MPRSRYGPETATLSTILITITENSKYLPDAALPEALEATGDIGEAVSDADVLVMGIPSSNFRNVLEEAKSYLRPWVPVISLTKGLELSTGKRMTEVIEDVLPGHPVGVLTGPKSGAGNHGRAGGRQRDLNGRRDYRQATPAAFPLRNVSCLYQYRFAGLRVGRKVLKNIIAIAVGMGDGLGAGDNTRSALDHSRFGRDYAIRSGHGWPARDFCRPDGNGGYDRHLHEPVEPKPACRWSS